jgi:sec-independent protein translocase protein TatB
MFDFDVGKLLLIGVVALIFIPPKDLPAALRQLGRLVAQARRIASEFQSHFNEAIRETELGDLKDEFSHLKKSASLEGAMEKVAEIVEPASQIDVSKEYAPKQAAPPVESAPVESAPLPEPAGPPPAPAAAVPAQDAEKATETPVAESRQ